MAARYWITGTTGDWSVAADWQSGAVPGSTDDATINNSLGVTVTGTAVANSLTLDNSSLAVSGSLTLGASLTLDGGELLLSGGTLSAQSINNADSGGANELGVGGYGTVGGAVIGYVTIVADVGTLKVQGSLAGNQGFFYIEGQGATLELSSGTAQPVLFYGSGTLKLDAPTAFTGVLGNIVLGDTIDLAGITSNSATYIGTTLTINESNGQQFTYNNVTGSLADDTVTTASDNNGGTLVYWTPPSERWITGGGDWSTAANWQSGVVPSSTDNVVINNIGNVTVDGSAVANSLTLNYAQVNVNGSLTIDSTLAFSSGFISLAGGTLSAQTVTVLTGEVSGIFGYGTVSITAGAHGEVWFVADGGTLTLEGSLAADINRPIIVAIR